MYNALGALGFGAVEVGTVTALGQPGNPRPRLFRLPDDGALLNRMGFNNDGAEAAAHAVKAVPPRGVVLGVNLGKSKVTPLERAHEDYRDSAARLGPLADYLVINVSSPNTPGLRALQSVEALEGIITAVRAATAARPVPLLVKLAPDLADEDLDAVTDLARTLRLDGLVATNTTIRRDGLRDPEAAKALGDGGVSGAPVKARSTEVIRRIRRRAGRDLTLIGVGGVRTADDAWGEDRRGRLPRAGLHGLRLRRPLDAPGASSRACCSAWTARACATSPPSWAPTCRHEARPRPSRWFSQGSPPRRSPAPPRPPCGCAFARRAAPATPRTACSARPWARGSLAPRPACASRCRPTP
jgi:dihydroorotate dehydrogenase